MSGIRVRVNREGKTVLTPSPTDRLKAIAAVLEAVDNRCAAADGPVTPTRSEITDEELRRIYLLATQREYSL